MESQSQTQSQTTKPKVRTLNAVKLCLDEYLRFVDNDKQVDFTINLLNQIIEMHGFKKIHKVQRKVLVDAVSTMELMDATRSTLNDDKVNSRAFMTLPEVVKDLVDLKWQECCVTSMQTLNSVNYQTELEKTEESSSKAKASKSVKRRKVRAPDASEDGGDGATEESPANSSLTALTAMNTDVPLNVDYSHSKTRIRKQVRVRMLSSLNDVPDGDDATGSATA